MRLDRRDGRLCKAQGGATCSVHLHRRRLFPGFSAGRPLHSEHRTFTVCGSFGWDFVRCDLWTLTGHRHRMVRDGSVHTFVMSPLEPQELTPPVARSSRLRERRLPFLVSACDGQRSLDDVWEGVRRPFVAWRARLSLSPGTSVLL